MAAYSEGLPVVSQNSMTVLHDDDDSDDEDLMVNLGKGRRSGLDRRVSDPDSAHQFRQEVEREYRAEIRQLRESNDQKDLKIERLEARIITIESRFDSYREANESTLNAAGIIVNAGIVLKYAIIGIIGITSAIGGLSIMVETIKTWFTK